MNVISVRNAFAQAASEFKAVQLRGKGHAHRASVSCGGAISKAAADGAGDKTAFICGSKFGAPRRVFPVALIEKAAAILGVSAERLIGRCY